MRALVPTCLAALALLAACGQRGPLVLPSKHPPAPVAAPAPPAPAPAAGTPKPNTDAADDTSGTPASFPKV